ncbi:protein translocase subunit SecF [bacterium]|nr:protein translocase subunit SecF [bacterium]
MFRLVKADINFDFVKKFKTFTTISAILVLVSIGLVATLGLNFGIDFRGGTNINYSFENRPDVNVVREILKSNKIEGNVNNLGDNEIAVQISREISLVSVKDIETIKSFIQENFQTKGLKKIRPYQEGSNKLRLLFDKKLDTAEILSLLKSKDFAVETVSSYGVDETSEEKMMLHQYDIEFIQLSNLLLDKIKEKSTGVVKISNLEQVGPKVGEKLKQDGVLSIIYALFAILVYIAFRFDSRFSPGAVVALAHDVLITLGIFSVAQIVFDLPVIAALLTLVGYSLNDTIVIFDKIREEEEANTLAGKNAISLDAMVNKALNSTLSRTLITSLTTLFVVIAMLVFGGVTLFPFSMALLVGIIVGTYSSLFIASPIYIYLEKRNVKRESELKESEA